MVERIVEVTTPEQYQTLKPGDIVFEPWGQVGFLSEVKDARTIKPLYDEKSGRILPSSAYVKVKPLSDYWREHTLGPNDSPVFLLPKSLINSGDDQLVDRVREAADGLRLDPGVIVKAITIYRN